MAPSSRYGLHEFDQTANQPAECYEKVATLFFFLLQFFSLLLRLRHDPEE
jgi:hypothetical protein